MGGRGASSGVSDTMDGGRRGGNEYGSMFRAVLDRDGKPMVHGNIKFVEKTEANNNEEALMETMTRGRVYVLVDMGRPKSIVYFDNDNKRSKQIDLDDRHGENGHVHIGYFHNENSPNGKPVGLSPREKDMVARVLNIWDNRSSKY